MMTSMEGTKERATKGLLVAHRKSSGHKLSESDPDAPPDESQQSPRTPVVAMEMPKPDPSAIMPTNVAMGVALCLEKKWIPPFINLGLVATSAERAVGKGDIATKISMDANAQRNFEPPDPSDPETRYPGQMDVPVFYIEEANWKALRKQYLEVGVPFILRHKNGGKVTTADTPDLSSVLVAPETEDIIRVVPDGLSRKLPGLDEIIKKLLPWGWRAYWPLWFSGYYTSGVAHVDLGPTTTNFYVLQSGRKDVVIAPLETTCKLKLSTGLDNLFVPGSAGNHDYLKNLDSFYRVTLEHNSLLVFNNSGSLHHFTNIIEEGLCPVACSVRCKYAPKSEGKGWQDGRGWAYLSGNLKVWWNLPDSLRWNLPDFGVAASICLTHTGIDKRAQCQHTPRKDWELSLTYTAFALKSIEPKEAPKA